MFLETFDGMSHLRAIIPVMLQATAKLMDGVCADTFPHQESVSSYG